MRFGERDSLFLAANQLKYKLASAFIERDQSLGSLPVSQSVDFSHDLERIGFPKITQGAIGFDWVTVG